MKMKKLLAGLVTATVLILISCFVSCEVGLGEAVDTRPPSIIIEKPEVDKVIRSKFIISGTWEDDGTIDNVYVLLKRTDGKLLDGKSLERKIEATFTIDELDDEKGTWQAIVDPLEKDNQIIDGSYQATVYIQDKGNHTTSQITTFTIDNTAPVLILSKPNSTPEDQTLSAYGQRLFLEGSIADSTKDTWIQLDFYSGEECTEAQYLTTIETEMISPTDVNSNNARLAIYNTDLTQKYATEYYKLYGKTEKSGAEQVYAKITVYDTAETCSVDGEEDTLTPSGKIKGNASQSFYLTKKLAESITKSQTANGYGLAPIDIYNVLNGTYVLKNESRAADAQSIKDELLSDEQKKSISVFTINPENSPYFTISGLKTLNLDGKDFEEGNTIVNGTQTLEVSVFMGSDSIALKDDENFYVYLLECDKYGKPVKEDVEENRIKLYSKYKETGSGSEKKIFYKVGGKTDHKTSSGAYVFSIPMNKSLRADPDAGLDGFVNINLEYGKNYIIRVSGKDTEGNDIETTDNGYGFCFTAGGTAPRITITEPADTTVFIKKGDGLHVKGSVTSEGGEPRFTVSNEANMVDLPLTPTAEGTWTFEKQIAPEELGFSQDESVIYSLIFSATRDATESTQTKSVWYDVEGPAITLSDPVPLVKTNTVKADGSTVEKDSINGKVTFSGSIIDEFDSRFGSASWKVEQNGVQVTGQGLSGSLEKNFTFQLDTTKLTDNKEAVVVISAYDFVGNLTEKRYTCWVDQSTDVPRITTTEEGKDISENADLAFVQQGNNLYQRGGSLVLSIADDDGVANARVKIEEYSNGTYLDPDAGSEEKKQDISYPSPSFISHVLPTSVGIYRATVTVHDKHYESDSSTQNNYKQIQFFLRVTGTGPDVSITPDKEYINNLAGGKYVLTFKVTNEGNGPYKFKKGTEFITDDVEKIDEETYKYEISPTTTASIKFEVHDNKSSFTEKTFVPRFDSEAPTVSITNWPDSTSLTEDATYLFKGEMSDIGNSGINKVQIKFVDGTQTSTDGEGWADCTAGSINWNSEITWSANEVFNTEGKKTVFVKAIDGAGNEATDYKTFTYDKSKPVLTVTNSLSTSETNIISDEVGSTGYVLSGTVTETNALATSNALVIKVDDQSSTITPNAATGEWSYTIAKGTTAGKLKSDASIEVELLAKDIAGKTDNKKYIIYYDTQAPELVVTAPAENEPVSTSSLAIKGTVSDNGYGVENVEYVLYSGNVTSANEASATKIQSDSKDVTSENFPIERKGEQWYIKNTSVNMPLGTTEGALTLKVKATEKTKNGHGGRTTTEYVPFYFDKANPTLTEASIGATGKTKNVGFALSGKAIDSNALASVIISWGTNNSVTLTPGEGEANEMNWSQSFVVGSETVETGTYKIADGTNEFTIIAKDITGKEKQMTRTVIVDTTKPVINATSITNSVGATIAGVSWYKNRSLSVEVTAVDANGDDGTGISMVEYSTSSDGGTTWSAWSPLSSFSNNLYKGTVSFGADGQNLKFKVHAIDVAGNESDESTITVNIDTTAPVLEALYYKKGEGTASTITSPIYIKENTKLTVYGNYKDEESGVNALTYAYGNPAIKYSTVALTETPVDSNYTLTAVTGSETSIKSWRAEFTPAESGAFTVTGSNRTGDSTNALKVFDVTVDKEAPVVDNVRLVISNSDKNAYSDGSKYYINNSAAAGKTFKISGVATDTVGVDSVELLITKNDSTTETKTPTRGGTLGQWYFDGIDLSDWIGTGASAKITVKDKAGNETIETLIIAFDVTAPIADHKIDDSLKNLEFRIGDAANDAGEPDVGGKYSDGTYGSALTMQIRGNFPDETNGSGINKFYYKTFNNEEVTIDSSKANGSIANGKIYFKTLDDLKDYVIANKTDVFSPLSTVELKNVEYNVGPFVDDDNKPLTSVADTVLTNDRIRFGGNPTTPKTNGNYAVNSKGYVQFRTSIATNFKTTIKGFVEGKNYLVIVAEDNAGNAAVDYAVVSGITYPCYSLNVDITAPTIPTKPEGSLFTNLEEEGGVVIAGTVSDMPNVTNGSSGLKKIVFTRDGGTGSVEVTTFTAPTAADLTAATEVSAAYSSDTTLKHWEADVSSLLPSSGMAIISAKVIDNAGFETSTSVATITVDRTGPSLKINSPTANAKVGKNFTISGTVDDGNGAGVDTTAGLELWYKVASGDWTKYATNPTLTGQNWTCNVNASFVSDGANTSVSFKVKAKDKSGTGNPGESAALAVTVDTKAPDKGTFNVEETADSALGTTWFNSTTVNINGTFTDEGGSGVKKVYYQVKTAGSTTYGTEKSVTSDGSYTINIKDLATGANTIKVYAEDSVGNKSDANADEYIVNVDDKAPTISSNHTGIIYANSNSCIVKLTVADVGGSEIDKVTLTVGDKAPVECTSSDGEYTKDIQSLLGEGTVSVTATASDKAGNTASKVIANVMRDTTAPTVVINTPAANAKTKNVISVSGSASDGVGSGVNTTEGITLYYTTASSGATTPTADTITSWTKYAGIQPTLSGSTWSGTFNVPDTVAPDTYNTDVYICVEAVDNAGTGNHGYSNPVKVTVDRKNPSFDSIKIGKKTLTLSDSPWFKDTTLVVEGVFTDAEAEGGSGVTYIKYRLNPDATVDSDTNTTSLPTTDGTYNTNISGFVTGTNFLKIWAVDFVGNASEKRTYTIKVDGTAPTITSDISGINYSNGSAAFPVSLTVSDDASGIATVVLSRDGTTSTVSCSPSNGKYTTSDISSLLPASGNATIMATATDNAGNTASTVAANILVDKKEPSVTLTAPADADTSTSTDATGIQVNGTISLSGTSSDENVISRVVGLLYKKANSATKPAKQTNLSATAALTSWAVPDGWTKVAATLSNANATTNWTFNGVDTTKLDGTNTITENSSIWFTVAVQDTAGNIGYSTPVQVYAKQDSDRPTITLSQLTKNTVTTLKTKNVYGSVTDDDGTLEKLWYWNGATAPTTAPSYTTTWVVPTGWNEITINGGSWSIDSTEEDGQTTWYFAVADADKTVFATVGTDTLKQPYLKYTDETDKVDGTAAGVTFKYDTNPPTATALYLYRAAAGTAITAAELAEDDSAITWSQEQNLAFGKDYNVLYAKVVVNESTGMKALTDAVPMSSPISISYTALEFSQIAEVVGTGTSAGTYTYYLGPLTMNSTEQHELKVTVEDAVGNKGYISRSIIVDNEAPVSITEVKPKSTVEISDVFTYRGNVSDNTGGSGVTKVEWYIPKSSETDATANTIAWTEASLSAGWEIDFSGDNNLSKIINYIPNGTSWTVDSGYSSYEISSGSGVYAIPVWFKITDAVGNVGYNKTNAVRYNPNTDRPSVQITSPSHNKTATIGEGNNAISIDYAIMGGSAARISGNADDNEGVDAIYLQFDLDDDGKWDNGVSGLTADMSALPGDSATLIAGCPWTKAAIEEIKYNNGTSTGYFGIKVSGTKNWSYTLDLSSPDLLHITETKEGEEPNITYKYAGQTIKVRAIAVDNDTENGQLVSAPSAVINISVNNNIPLFSNLKVKQINASNTVLSEDDYTDGKFLTGENWYITGDVYAYGGISSASYTGVTDASSCFSPKVDSEGTESTTDFDMKIPVVPDTNGQWKVRITVYDTNESGNQPNIQDILIHIDNDAPTFNDSYTDDDDIDAYGTAKHFLNSYGTARGTLLTPTIKIQDTNGLASIWGRVTDTGSGFDKAVFYFKRFDIDGESNPRIYNPMEQNNNRTDLGSKAVGKVYINANELPALVVETNETAKMTVTRPVENDCTIQVTLGAGATVSGVAGNKNVRKGGLIKIGGKYRTITDVDYTNGIVTFDPPCDRSFDTAEIIYAMVVDSTGETMTGNTINEEDGDGMQENFSDVSGTVTWNAAIKTSYIPDGPLELHVVAFDVAGNISNAYTKTGVNNNPLRLTKVMLGTDLNADNSYSSSEYETFYAITTSRGEHDLASGVERWDLDTRPNETSQYFTVKKGLSVIPEFVGGTGDVYYKFKKGTTDLEEAETLTTAELATNKLAATSVAVEGTGNKIGQFSLASDTIGYGTADADEDKMHIFSFSFWDSTESSTAGQNSSWTVLNAKIHQDLKDGVAPTGNITPFYWKSKTENSVVWSGSGSSATALGHIELENDLPTDTFKDTNKASETATAPSGEYDRDPKVSGQIYIEGAAFDETRLGSITVTFANKSVTANYTPGSGWSQADGGYGTITITDAGPAQSGHSVTWKWLVNTAEVVTNKVADIDKTITVSVKDANPNTSAASSTQTTSDTATAYYRVDIVPYITKLYSGISETAGEEFARSATGKYIVRGKYLTGRKGNWTANTETLRMFGFNLAADSTTGNVIIGSTNNIKTTASNAADTTKYGAHLTFPVGTGTSSGKLSITVNSITSLNNINASPTFEAGAIEASEGSSAMYNSQANGKTNDRLTDDVDLWIWDMNYFLDETDITSPMLKMDKSGNYYMSYGYSVPSMYVNKNGTTRQVDYSYNKFHNTNVIFDDNGNLYAVATATDRVINDSSRFVLYTPYSTTDYLPDYVDSSSKYEYQYLKTSKRHLEMAYNKDTSVYNINRVKRPKLASYTDGDDTYLAMAYFDYNNNDSPVKFRFGKKSAETTTVYNPQDTEYTFRWRAQNSGFRANNSGYTNINGNNLYVKIGNNYYPLKRNGNNGSYYYTFSGYTSQDEFTSVTYTTSEEYLTGGIMNNLPQGHDTDTPTYECSASGYHIVADKNTDCKGGEYTAVGIIPSSDGTNGYIGVVAWYDASVRRICYSYNTDPDTVDNDVWQTNAIYLDTDQYTGWYVDLAVDAGGGIHIAYYNSAKGDLKYVYLSSYDADPTDPITIDSYLSVGTNITVNTRLENGKYVPYIYYYNTSSNQTPNSIKVAWREDMTTLRDGAISDKFTGAWESMTIPTVNIPSDATVCGGVPSTSTTAADNKTIFLGYMSDVYYEKATIKGDVTQ